MRSLAPLVALLAALFLTGATCSPDPGAESGAAPYQDCAARGGELRRVGRMGSWQCITPFADAGRPCTDGSQCAGDCRLPDAARTPLPDEAVAGVCQADSSRFGCFTTVENGRAGPTICID